MPGLSRVQQTAPHWGGHAVLGASGATVPGAACPGVPKLSRVAIKGAEAVQEQVTSFFTEGQSH